MSNKCPSCQLLSVRTPRLLYPIPLRNVCVCCGCGQPGEARLLRDDLHGSGRAGQRAEDEQGRQAEEGAGAAAAGTTHAANARQQAVPAAVERGLVFGLFARRMSSVVLAASAIAGQLSPDSPAP